MFYQCGSEILTQGLLSAMFARSTEVPYYMAEGVKCPLMGGMTAWLKQSYPNPIRLPDQGTFIPLKEVRMQDWKKLEPLILMREQYQDQESVLLPVWVADKLVLL